MNDLISRQAAIDAIFGRSHEIIKMRIGNLPSVQPKQQWVLCSERLPTRPGRYLVTQKIPYGMRVTIAYFDWNEFWDEAVAWMPLPEPYKEEP